MCREILNCIAWVEIVLRSFSKTGTALLKRDLTETLTTQKEYNVANNQKILNTGKCTSHAKPNTKKAEPTLNKFDRQIIARINKLYPVTTRTQLRANYSR